MGEQGRDAQRVQEIRARLQDRWYSAEQTREDVRYLLARLEALAAERDESVANMAITEAWAERDALAGRLAALEAEVKRLTERAIASDETVNAIMQDLVDMPPDDPEHEDTLSTSYDHLVLVLNRHILGIE